jgi:hypothetical protein
MRIHSINGDGVREDDSLARSYLAPDAAMITRIRAGFTLYMVTIIEIYSVKPMASAGSGSPTGTWHNHGP